MRRQFLGGDFALIKVVKSWCSKRGEFRIKLMSSQVGNGSSALRFKWPGGGAKVAGELIKETAFQGRKTNGAEMNRLGHALQVVELCAHTRRKSLLHF